MFANDYAPKPSYASALEALERFQAAYAAKLKPAETETLHEISRRIRRLNEQARELIDLNNGFIEQREFHIEFDPATDIITIYGPTGVLQQLKLKRADPNIPITMNSGPVTGGYKPEEAKA